MDENREIVLIKQARRYQFLMAIWRAVKGEASNQVNVRVLGDSLGFSFEETLEIYAYLSEEGFFSMNTCEMTVTLSHKAIVEIEKSITKPSQSTEHFSTTVIQHFNAPVSSVQTGANSIAYVNQNIGGNISEILQVIEKLREQFNKLPNEESQEAIDIIDALSEEVKSPQPNKGKVKAFLTATKSFASDVTSATLATTLAEAIAKGLGIS
jgi:hypothetical protein